MSKKTASVYIISVPIYKVSVIIYINASLEGIISHAIKKGVKKEKFTKRWKNWVEEQINDKTSGFCCDLGEGNKDVLVWIRERPEKLSQYATLCHELYHAVDNIADSRNFDVEDKMSEPRAYLFEYLFQEISSVLWNNRKNNKGRQVIKNKTKK